jgi:hypothetical protein
LRVFSAGNGHLRPVKSSFVCAMVVKMAKGMGIVNRHGRPH